MSKLPFFIFSFLFFSSHFLLFPFSFFPSSPLIHSLLSLRPVSFLAPLVQPLCASSGRLSRPSSSAPHQAPFAAARPRRSYAGPPIREGTHYAQPVGTHTGGRDAGPSPSRQAPVAARPSRPLVPPIARPPTQPAARPSKQQSPLASRAAAAGLAPPRVGLPPRQAPIGRPPSLRSR